MVDSAATAPMAAEPVRAAVRAGTLLGRYVVLAPLGAGGSGEVYAAYDPQLDRKVALKRLRGQTDAAPLLREARMLAKLRHPNVVTIYDVEVDAGEAHLAMELVEGTDLGAWLRTNTQASGAQRLALLRAAAAGLHAAHQAGIVHGDIKPANILVGHDGRVQVGDFGVARQLSASDRTDRIFGTPLYMAPEQHDGCHADVRSDVFAFAVMVWETLAGEHPYAGAQGLEVTPASGTSALQVDESGSGSNSGSVGILRLAEAKRSGPPCAPTQLPDIRGARMLFEALRDGLQPSPEARPTSLAALREALEPKAPARWWLPALIVAAGGGAVAAVAMRQPDQDTRCAGSRDRLGGAWTEARAVALEDHWQGMGPPWQGHAAQLRSTLDDYATRWVQAHRANCEATSIRAEQTAKDSDLRSRCLLDARASLGASVSLLEDANPEVARRADAVVASLPNLDRCADVRKIEAQTRIPDDPTLRAEVDTLRDAIAKARASLYAGDFAGAHSALEPLVQRAQALGYAPLMVELGPAWASALDRVGDSKAAFEVWEACARDGIGLGLVGPAFSCASTLAEELAQRDARFDAAHAWVTTAAGLADHAAAYANANDDLLRVRSTIAYEQADYETARALDETLVEQRLATFGPIDHRVGTALVSLGNTQHRAGDLKAAEATLLRAIDVLEAAVGPEHPLTAAAEMNLGTVFESRGANEEALAMLRRAQSRLETALGPEHEELSLLHTNIAVNLTALGQFEDALAEYDKALAIIEGVHGPTHVEAGRIRMNVGVVYLRQQDYDRAEQMLAQALEILEQHLPEDHEHRISCKLNLALAIASKGELAKARPLLEEVLASREATLPPNHPSLAGIHGNLGHMLLELEDPAEAKPHFEQALKIRAANPSRPKDRAFETLGLGRAVHALGERDLGVALANEAIVLWREAGPGYDSYREEAEAWLKQVRG